MKQKIKILHLEDVETDAQLIAYALQKGNICPEILVVSDKADFIKALKNFSYDIIISDHSLVSFDSLEAIRLVRQAGITAPFILVTAAMTDLFAAKVMKEGACDYILKDRLHRLPSAVINAIEKHDLEEEREAAHKKLVFHLENTPLGFIEWDSQLHIKALSKQAEQIFGWNLEEFSEYQRNGYSHVYQEDLARVTKISEDMVNGAVERNTIRYRNLTKDGEVIWCEWFNSVSKDKDGKVVAIMSLVQDITAYKTAEDKLSKTNRLYAFISQINQSIVRIKDEQELFREVCNIAFKFGKFNIAWIGLFDDLNKQITLVDQNGIPTGNVSQFKDIPLKNGGPQELVMRTGKYYLCNDIANDVELESWHSLSVEYGIHSCMILPVKKSGKVIGTFNLYSDKLNFYDKEEIGLLLEVTGDISFALDTFEKVKQHKEAEELVVQNEKLFRALIENSADMKTLGSREGKLIYGSPSITAILGYSPEELINMSLFDVVHPDDLPQLLESRNQLLKNPGKSFNFQHRRKHKNGSWVWCEGTFTNMLDEPGIRAIVTNFRDISAKKALEQQQEFDKNNLDALINNTNDLMWSVDMDFNLITSNQPFDDILKLTSGQSVAKGDSILAGTYSPEQAEPYKKLYERAFMGESFTEVMYNELPVDSWSEISYCPIRKKDEVIGAACHSRDITEKIKTERQIIINERRFRALVENGADAVAVFSPDGKPTYISPSTQRILGYTGEDAKGMDMFTITHPDDLAGFKLTWGQMLLGYGMSFPAVTRRVRHKNGGWRWLEGTLTNLLQDTSVKGIVNNFRDVTEKKLAEEELLLTEFAIDSAGDAVFWMTADARIVKTNEAACTMLGYTRQEMMSLSIPDIDPYYDPEKWLVHYEDLRRKGSLFFETIQQAKDGRLIPVEIRANYVKFGEAEYNCAFSRDISERKLAEKKLVESETKLKEAQALAQMGNFEIDLSNYLELWSDEMYKLLGLINFEIVPSTQLFLSFIHPDDVGRVQNGFEECVKSKINATFDFRFFREDGAMRHGCTEARFEFDKERRAVRLFGIFQDITDRKLAEIERTKMVNDIVLRNTELEQFGYIISHNLRAPVANIIGASGLMNDPGLSAEDKEMLNAGINASVIKLDSVVKDLNHILEVKAEINDTKEIVLFSLLTNDIMLSIQGIVDQYRIEIKYDFSAIDEFLSQRAFLYSIFYNLVSNSIKYRRQDIHTVIEIKSRLLKNKLQLIFADNGMGINLKRYGSEVFGLYKRFHYNVEGKGMGLFMAKTQVEMLGGTIRLQSEENKGTKFYIEFEI